MSWSVLLGRAIPHVVFDTGANLSSQGLNGSQLGRVERGFKLKATGAGGAWR